MAAGGLVMIQAARQPQTFPVFVAAALVLGLLQIAAWRQNGFSVGMVLGLAVIWRIVAFPVPPVLSNDMYRYVWDGWVVLDGMNPYAFRPSDAIFSEWHGQPLAALLNSADFYSVYPPVSQVFFAAGAFLGREIPGFGAIPGPSGEWWPSWMGIKMLFSIAEVAGVVMLSRMLQPRTLMLVALSPVLLIAGSLQGHTDILLLPLLAAGVISWAKGRWGTAIVWITLAAWVKLLPLVLLPFLVLGASPKWRDRLRLGALAAGVSVLVWIPFAATYVPEHIASSLELYVAWFEFNAGPYYLVKEWYEFRTGADWSKQIGPAFRRIHLVILFVFGGMALLMTSRLRFMTDAVASRFGAGTPDEDRARWWAWKVGYAAWVLHLVFSTTVHPWYLVGVLLLGVILFEKRIPWHWWVLATLSVGTYLLYSHGPEPYWWFVRLAWGAWGLTWIAMRSPGWLQGILAWRAAAKYSLMRPWVGEREDVLDLGGGEGYLAWRLRQANDRRKTIVAEVRDAVVLPVEHLHYDGFVLPINDNTFNVVVLGFVLHHAEDQEQVLREALRVARQRVIVLESTYGTGFERILLRRLDLLANRIRSASFTRSSMQHQKEHLHHRTNAEWITMASRTGGHVIACRPVRRPFHRQFLFVVTPE